MKARKFQRAIGVAVATAFLVLLVVNGLAQDSANKNAVPQLTPNVAAIVKLAQAKVSDDAIIAYINKTRSSYDLDAAQIIYLHQAGIPDAVITAMLSQTEMAKATVPIPTAPAPQPVASAAYEQPAVTYVVTEPTTYYDYQPYYYPVYGGYYWSYPVIVSHGWGGYRHFGAWHSGGWHGGGVVRSGGFVHGGGFAHGGGGVVHGGGGGHAGGHH